MNTFTIDDSVFAELKNTPGINQFKLQSLVDYANSNPVLNALLTKAVDGGDMQLTLFSDSEQAALGANTVAKFFNVKDEAGTYSLAINQRALIGYDHTWNDSQVLGYVTHELQHYADQSLFLEANRWTNDLTFHPEITSELDRFENYMLGTMQAEVRGWITQVKVFRAEVNQGDCT